MVCGMTEEDPTFGEIVDIFQTPTEETLFVMRMLSVSHFSTHYHADCYQPCQSVHKIYRSSPST